MLVVRLDQPSVQLPWVIVFAPFNISVLLLLLLFCCMPNSSRWWFGIKEDYCKFLFVKFPSLRSYANFAIYVHHGSPPTTESSSDSEPELLPEEPTETTEGSGVLSRLFTRKTRRHSNTVVLSPSGDIIGKIPEKFDLFAPD